MNIAEYDHADALGVLSLNLLSLGYALTPELIKTIRRLDKRPFPFFALYAIEDNIIVGQIGVFRLPTITTEGPEDVGGVWAVSTHPAFNQQGIASYLLDEAHARMQSAGLRFSTLGTSRYLVAHKLYQKHGYEDIHHKKSTLVRRDFIQDDYHLVAERANSEQIQLTDDIFKQVAAHRLGFARRPADFLLTLVESGDLNLTDIWLLRRNNELIGYVIASIKGLVLTVKNLLLIDDTFCVSALASLLRDLPVTYMEVGIDSISLEENLQLEGFPPARITWGTFMVKPLIPEVTVEDARRLFGVGTKLFLISDLDIT